MIKHWLSTTVTMLAVMSALADEIKTPDNAIPKKVYGAPNYSFENNTDLEAWTPHPFVKLENSRDWASDGEQSLKFTIGKVPWFGAQQETDLTKWRDAEFLEIDIHAATSISTLNVMLRGCGLQDVLITKDQLRPGENWHIRFRIADNTMVQFGNVVVFQFYTSNDKETPVIFYVDNIRLTGNGPVKRMIVALTNRIKHFKLGPPELQTKKNLLLEKCSIQLAKDTRPSQIISNDLHREWQKLLEDNFPTNDLMIGEASPLTRVRRADLVSSFDGILGPQAITLSIAGSEYESRQLVCFFKGKQKRISAEFEKLPPSFSGELHWVDEISIADTTQKPGEQIKGMIPDPLLPPEPITVPAGENRSLWMSIRASAGIKPGNYEGSVALTIDGIKTIVPLQLRAYDFQLPEKPTLNTMFNPWSHNWANFYGWARYTKGAWHDHPDFDAIPRERQLELIDFCAKYRMGISGALTYGMSAGKPRLPVTGNATTGFKLGDWSEIIERCLKTTDFVMLGEISGQTFKNGQPDTDAVKLLERYAHDIEPWAGGKWKGRSWFYLIDEARTKEQQTQSLTETQILKTAAPDIKVVLTTCTGIPPWSDTRFRSVDMFVALLDRLELREAEQYQKNGRKILWYPACVVYEPFPIFAITSSPFSTRVMPVLTFKYNIDGILYWAINLWGDANCDPDRMERWPDVPWSMKDWYYPPGEGHLYYPGRRGTPWPSIRLENWRDGMEDYEYLVLLKSVRNRLSPEFRIQADLLLEMTGVVDERYDYTLDPEIYQQWRDNIAKLIEKGNK